MPRLFEFQPHYSTPFGRWMIRYTCVAVVIFVSSVTVAMGAVDEEYFEKVVRPLLAEECYACHGPKKQESGLRLDSKAALLKGGDSGPAVSLEDAEASLLLQVIKRGGDIEMPPEKALTKKQVAALEQWIRGGAPWPVTENVVDADDRRDHWAFQPVQSVTPPKLQSDWSINSIDSFILRRLRDRGISPTAAADRITLIRRATFDLTGLPPTPREVEQFVSDPSADAYEKLVDRLLKSPRYGERWGRYWLDVARYADNKGYVFFEEKTHPWAWTYRDWVIRSLNEDLPFDQFVIQQIAADHLDLGEDKRPLAAMGFLTVGARFVNNTHDVIDDRIDVVTRGFMGLTVTCARCHDHKFDPVPQRDYYSLYGVFRSSQEPIVQPAFLPPENKEGYADYERGLAEHVAKYDEFVAKQRTLLQNDSRERAADYLAAVHRKRNHPTTEDFMLLTEKGAIIPAMILRWENYLKQAAKERDPVWRVWHEFAQLENDEFGSRAEEVHAALFGSPDGDRSSRLNRLVADRFRDSVPRSIADVADGYEELLQQTHEDWEKVAREGKRRFDDPAKEALRLVLLGPDAPGVIPESLGWGFLDLLPDRPTQGEYKKILKELEQFSMKAVSPPRAMVLEDSPAAFEPYVFLRGNPNRQGAEVPRRFLKLASASHPAPFEKGSGRLELAQAIVDPANPLTSRVIVNRLWSHHFGHGIVATPNDFGVQGARPSHPDLLDWLAEQLVEDGWSLKRMHKRMMMSATYRQSSRTGEGELKQDPENQLFSRFTRRRLDFEAMRDSLVYVTGELDVALGGRPVKLLNGFNRRRSVYGFIDRMDVPGVLRNFDFPEPIASSGKRVATTVPAQALYFLNHDFVAQCANKVSRRRELRDFSSDTQKIEYLYQLLFGRSATKGEVELASAFLAQRDEQGEPSPWRYGYGAVDAKSGRVSSFADLPYWTGQCWQGGDKLPDGKLGWLFMTADGGHPAASYDRCCIRRWTSPADAQVSIRGELAHQVDKGNGVRGRIVSSRDGILGSWKVANSKVKSDVESLSVRRGDTLDFVVDFQDNIYHDEHLWKVAIQQLGDEPAQYDSISQFRGGSSDVWTNYVHALLMTNEFLFVE